LRPDSRIADHKLVFVGGLHRSGTSLVARCLGAHPAVSVFRDTGVPEDEGQHLQTVYRPAKDFGGPGRFAFASDAHLTEGSPLVSEDSRRRLMEEWGGLWDQTKPVLLEKSPPNLVRGRFLQALFPGARLVMVLRHPLAVSYATQKWSQTSLRALVRHWLAAHETFAADLPRLEHVHVVRFEDFVADPGATLGELYAFLELEPVPPGIEIRPDANEAYFARWRQKPALSRRLLTRAYEKRVAAFGYSLVDLARADRWF
jgi:Sulfotransferase family